MTVLNMPYGLSLQEGCHILSLLAGWPFLKLMILAEYQLIENWKKKLDLKLYKLQMKQSISIAN